MRLTFLAFVCFVAALPALAIPAGGRVVVRAIAFVASNERARSDPQLGPYERVLRANLRFESFHFVGASSAAVGAGGSATLGSPGGRIDVRFDPAVGVTVRHRGTTVIVSPGRPAVFLGGAMGRGRVSGVIVLVE